MRIKARVIWCSSLLQNLQSGYSGFLCGGDMSWVDSYGDFDKE